MTLLKRFIGTVLSGAMIFSIMSICVSAYDHKSTEIVVYDYFNAINNQDWDSVIDYSADKDDMELFIKNSDEKIGILSIEDVNVRSLVTVSPKDSINYNSNFTKYGDLQVGYLVGLDTEVTEETKYFYNGFNLYFILLVQEEGTWGVLEFSQATPELIQSVYSPNARSIDPDILDVLNALEKRKEGVFTNLDGDVLEVNKASQEQLIQENGGSPIISTFIKGNQFDRPDTLRVYLKAGYVVNVDYYEWTQVVLFQEFGTNFIYNNNIYGAYLGQPLPMSSLEAGAQAVKARGWYGYHFPLAARQGADVSALNDGTYFIGAAKNQRCTQAINNVSGYLPVSSAWNVFPAQWADNATHTWTTQGRYSGQMYQSGTWYLGLNGYSWQDIIHYYYDYSKWSSGEIIMLRY